MDELDRQLLNAIQSRVPLVARPFATLADGLGCDESTVIDRVANLRGDGIIREISAIFDAVKLGYRQALVAMSVPPDQLDRAGEITAAHPGVSHCYGRAGDVNLWLTLAISPRSPLGLEGSAELLARLAGATGHMVLPTLRRYKLQVRFDMESGAPAPAPSADDEQAPGATGPAGPADPTAAPDLTDTQLRTIRALQIDLPAKAEPFAEIAAAESLDTDALLTTGQKFLDDGFMRRYAAVLYHRAAGSKANLLVAWRADAALADAAGPKAARVPGVSHCYLRPAGPDWPYTVYTMIHGRSQQDCLMAAEQIVATTELSDHVELWTTAEYKKRRVPLFGPEEAQWEAEHVRKTFKICPYGHTTSGRLRRDAVRRYPGYALTGTRQARGS